MLGKAPKNDKGKDDPKVPLLKLILLAFAMWLFLAFINAIGLIPEPVDYVNPNR